MRGTPKSQPDFLALYSPEAAVPKEHPIRPIKKMVDLILKEMSPLFDAMYAVDGRPSIPPERLLKAQVLIALFSVRSRNFFVEQLHYNLLFRWFLDLDLSDGVFDDSVFSKNHERLLKHEVARTFFEAVIERARLQDYVGDEHFTVDGTLIEAWASCKSFKPKDGSAAGPSTPGRGSGSNPSVDFHGEKRSNATHESSSDPEARLYKKGKGKEARLCFGAHALMDNRHGLCLGFQVEIVTDKTEGEAALELLQKQREAGVVPHTVGTDKGYHDKGFVGGCRKLGIIPHVAEIKGRRVQGLDGRTTHTPEYAVSQRVRKKVEEIFGWVKTVGGFRKSRVWGRAKTQMEGHFVAGAYNLLRMAKLGTKVSPV